MVLKDVIGPARLVPLNFDTGRAWLDATTRLYEPFYDDCAYQAGYFRDVLLHGFRQLRLETTINLPLEVTADWTVPVCLIHGERDESFRVSIAEDMAATLPNAVLHVVLHVVPDQSHALIFRQPWKVLRLMQSFLSDQSINQPQAVISRESDCRQL